MRARLWAPCLLLALTLGGLARAQTAEQEAGDVSEIDRDALGPLKARIPPVSGHYFLRRNRWELTPSVSLSIKDAFFSKYILGGALTYHPTETLGIVLKGGYSLVTVSGAAEKCLFPQGGSSTTPVCSPPSYSELDGVAPGQILGLAGLDLQWAPLYGKISLLAEKFVHFDLYGIAGPAAILYGGPRTQASPTAHVNTWTVGGDVGLGMHFFLNHWVTVHAEFRDLIYQEDTSSNTTSLRNQLVVDLGFSFFFPTTFEEG